MSCNINKNVIEIFNPTNGTKIKDIPITTNAKFSEIVMEETKVKPELPEGLKDIINKKEKFDKLQNKAKVIQKYILEKIKSK